MTGEVLVAGGSRGVGRSAALAFARRGCRVWATGRLGAREVVEAARGEGLDMCGLTLDVADNHSVRRLRSQLGTGLDVLLVTAGTAVTGSMRDTTPPQLERMLSEHVVGALRLVGALRDLLARRSGQVILVSSQMASRPRRHGTAYGTAKAALEHLAGCMAIDMADEGVRVTCIRPGAVDTDLFRSVVPVAARRGVLHPDEAARAILRLADSDAPPGTVFDLGVGDGGR